MKIDTEIRHVTKPGANLFLELGIAGEEAQRLHLASQQQIDEAKQQSNPQTNRRSNRPVSCTGKPITPV